MYAAPKKGALSLELQRELVHGYYAATTFIDAQIGQLIDALAEHDLTENTIVVVWGDHGWHLGDHGMWCKHTNYEKATRSPLLVVPPNDGRPRGSVTSPVELIDVYPTLLGLIEEVPASDTPLPLQGKSLLPLLHDPDGSVKRFEMSQFSRRTADATYEGYAFRTRHYRYVEWREMDRRAGDPLGSIVARELYDYRVDPRETKNLIHDPHHSEVLKGFESMAESFLSNQ